MVIQALPGLIKGVLNKTAKNTKKNKKDSKSSGWLKTPERSNLVGKYGENAVKQQESEIKGVLGVQDMFKLVSSRLGKQK